MTVSLLAADSILWSPFWLGIGMIFLVERLVTVWRVGWWGRALAAPIFPELAYVVFLQACFVTSIVQIMLGTQGEVELRAAARRSRACLTPWLGVWLLTAWGILLPTWILQTDWYNSLALWVGFNTLVFAFLSVLQLLPPLHRRSRAVTPEA